MIKKLSEFISDKFERYSHRELVKLIEMKEMELFYYLQKCFPGRKPSYIGEDFIYYEGNKLLPLFVSHIDTVTINKLLVTFKSKDIVKNMFNFPLGSDDRAGVFAIIELAKKYNDIPILFTNKEEIGAWGAREFATYAKNNNIKFPFMIEFDRKGRNESVYYNYESDEFKKFINDFGFETNTGTFSDILPIGNSLNINGVNLSIGYLNQHTNEEILNISWMMETIEKSVKIIDYCYKNEVSFKYEYSRFWSYGSTYGGFNFDRDWWFRESYVHSHSIHGTQDYGNEHNISNASYPYQYEPIRETKEKEVHECDFCGIVSEVDSINYGDCMYKVLICEDCQQKWIKDIHKCHVCQEETEIQIKVPVFTNSTSRSSFGFNLYVPLCDKCYQSYCEDVDSFFFNEWYYPYGMSLDYYNDLFGSTEIYSYEEDYYNADLFVSMEEKKGRGGEEK